MIKIPVLYSPGPEQFPHQLLLLLYKSSGEEAGRYAGSNGHSGTALLQCKIRKKAPGGKTCVASASASNAVVARKKTFKKIEKTAVLKRGKNSFY
ncbi:hypothetical protein HNQ91_005409 [Filimonas zeae]|uniref:hypothetical protein n=1 Tax=Filimonas zeae TaxID=1737353 RepID=UPI00166ED96D|nr:hypothetical protein [Filimonas zeae]MDR6342325.1 hypothetical protein [Filimonas zeae]